MQIYNPVTIVLLESIRFPIRWTFRILPNENRIFAARDVCTEWPECRNLHSSIYLVASNANMSLRYFKGFAWLPGMFAMYHERLGTVHCCRHRRRRRRQRRFSAISIRLIGSGRSRYKLVPEFFFPVGDVAPQLFCSAQRLLVVLRRPQRSAHLCFANEVRGVYVRESHPCTSYSLYFAAIEAFVLISRGRNTGGDVYRLRSDGK